MASVKHSNLFSLAPGILKTQDACVVIVRTEWNAAQVDRLESGCRKVLEQAGVTMIQTVTVPGAFEVPFGIRTSWERSKYMDNRPCAFIALGCIIQGDTPHFDYICRAITDGVLQLNLSLPVPVIFGVLTVLNEKQAMDRLGGPHGHKGEEAAMTALKMIALQQSYQQK